MKKLLFRIGVMSSLLMLVHFTASSQGSTSSRINGQVVSAGESLIGATVLATHEPTGFQYGTNTNLEGYFTLNNVNVGGPYTISITYVGYEEETISNVFLALGQTETFNVQLSESSVTLDEIVVTAGGLFDGNRTGSETKVSEEMISSLPTADRGLTDYLRVSPQASVQGEGGVSFAGVNQRFNSIFIDGAVNNDVFGLANSGTNGGQAGVSPISPDAIEQIQLVLAPYDVTLGGFAGGGINAVTRSGTNCFQGSAYYFFRNQNLSGKTPTDDDSVERTKLADFSARTFGARLGGPLIKNKLFFFTNVEIQRDQTPKPFIESQYLGDSDAATLEAIRQKLLNDYGYDPGEFASNSATLDGEKVLFKLDYQINQNHKLTARHSYVKGVATRYRDNSATLVRFGNTGDLFPSTTNSSAVELKSVLGDNVSNNLIIGRTTVRDNAELLGDPFPSIVMPDGAGQVIAGSFNFAYSNIVNQDVFTITNNFNLFKGKHNWTFGTHNEFFKVENLFTIFSTPQYEYFFNGVNRFLAGENADLLLFGHEQAFEGAEIRLGDDAANLGPTFNAMQLAFYGQDEIQVNKDLKITAGLRLDLPIFSDDPPLDNVEFNNSTIPLLESAGWDLQGARASQAPATQLLFSPRIGFNYDVNGDNSFQLRGGAGIFTSRVPWVWPGGMFIRNGLNSAFNVRVGVGQQEILGEPQEWIENLTSDRSPTGDVDLFVEDFKYPQILRGSLAADRKLGNGWNATAEFTYSKTLNNMDVKQINISPTSAGPLSATDSRATINFSDKIDPTYSNITLVSNTSEGYTTNFTLQLSKIFSPSSMFNIAYSYTDAKSLLDARGFINNTNWEDILSVRGNNNPSVARSTFAVGSRITAFLSHKFNYSDLTSTTISLFYTGKSGTPFSYTYNTPMPFEHVIDLKLSQDLNIGGQNFQITFDVFNFTNLLNKNWGRRYFVGDFEFPLIQAQRNGDTGDAEFQFRDTGDPWAIVQSGTYSARWNAQLGVRYSFDQCGSGSTKKAKSVKVDSDGDGIRDSKDMCPNIPGIRKFKGCPMSEEDMAAKAAAEEKARVEAEMAAKKAAEEKARLEAEAEKKRVAEAAAARKAKEEAAAAKLKAEEEAKLKAEEEARLKAAAEAETKAKAAAEAIRVRNAEVSRRFSASLQGLKFNSSQSTFKQESYARMDEAVAVLNEYPDINVLIQGHTDSQGGADANRSLSQKRADAVMNYLVSKGISNSRLSSSGLGEEYPIADNNTSAGRAQNRRVEFIIRNN